MPVISSFEPNLATILPDTNRLLQSAQLVIHPAVQAVLLYRVAGPAGRRARRLGSRPLPPRTYRASPHRLRPAPAAQGRARGHARLLDRGRANRPRRRLRHSRLRAGVLQGGGRRAGRGVRRRRKRLLRALPPASRGRSVRDGQGGRHEPNGTDAHRLAAPHRRAAGRIVYLSHVAAGRVTPSPNRSTTSSVHRIGARPASLAPL